MDVKSFILGLQVGSQSAGGGGGSGESGGSTENMVSYEDMATGNLPEIINLKNATTVSAYSFYGCKMKEVLMPNVTIINIYAFSYCINLQKPGFSEGLTEIKGNAYSACSKLNNVTFPQTLKTIGTYAFSSCKSIQTVTFKSKMSSIAKNAFSGCSGLQTINCPWAEGEVADAPWGATKATIVYNYTGG